MPELSRIVEVKNKETSELMSLAGLVGTMVKTLAYQSNGSEFESRCRLATPLSTGDLSPLGSDPDDFCGRRNGR